MRKYTSFKIFLLRGNHEFYATNARYGFPLDFHERYSHEVRLRAGGLEKS